MKRKQSKGEAVVVLLRDVRNPRPSKTSEARVERALRTLGLTDEDRHHVRYYLEYENVPSSVAYPKPQAAIIDDSGDCEP